MLKLPNQSMFEVWTRVGSRNHVFGIGSDRSEDGVFLGGGFFRLVVKYRKYLARAKVIHQHPVAAVMHPTAVGTAATC